MRDGDEPQPRESAAPRFVPLAAGSSSFLEPLVAALIARAERARAPGVRPSVDRGATGDPVWTAGLGGPVRVELDGYRAYPDSDAAEATGGPAVRARPMPGQSVPVEFVLPSRVPGTDGGPEPDTDPDGEAHLARLVAIESEIAALQAERAEVLVELADRADERAGVTPAAIERHPRPDTHRRELERRSLVAEVACALRLPERSIDRLVSEAEALGRDLPATLGGLSTGAITYRHAQRMVDHALSLPPAARPAFEAAALPLAARLTSSRFDAHARRLRERMHPDTVAERARRAATDRTVALEPVHDGMAWLHALLPARRAAEAFARVRAAAAGLARVDGEERTEAQLRADVLSDLLTGRADAPDDGGAPDESFAADARTSGGLGGPARGASRAGSSRFARTRPTVFVTVPVLTLLGASDEPGDLHGVGPIDADTARELAARAPSFIRILTHPETGARLSIGRDRYAVPSDLRAALVTRDETCRFPGCGRGAEQCEVDHVADWARGGPTDAANLAMLCPKHHHLKHDTEWSSRIGPDPGTIEWRSPNGRRHTSDPPAQGPLAQAPPAQGPPAQGEPTQPPALPDDPPF